jgi:lysylphosphatidylglycerol synthetase-like protein (DUF2156 family)
MAAVTAAASLLRLWALSLLDACNRAGLPARRIPITATVSYLMRLSTALQTTSVTCLALSALLLASCQREAPRQAVNGAALPTMERVALAANACWFKSGDSAFKSYRLAPELTSFSGRPRILIVPRNSPESRPLLVVQAEGNPAKLAAFGPLLDSGLNSRITADVNRWSKGNKSCS